MVVFKIRAGDSSNLPQRKRDVSFKMQFILEFFLCEVEFRKLTVICKVLKYKFYTHYT